MNTKSRAELKKIITEGFEAKSDYQSIADRLNKLGFVTKRGAQWTRMSVNLYAVHKLGLVKRPNHAKPKRRRANQVNKKQKKVQSKALGIYPMLEDVMTSNLSQASKEYLVALIARQL
jgi:hypothetical protein